MLPTVSNTLKSAAAAALLGIGLAGAGAVSASADTFHTTCYGVDCYRVLCNDDGRNCERVGYYQRDDTARPYRSRYICDAYGDNCRWVRTYDDRVYYDDQRAYDDDDGY
jgi:hypothetical protein